jgi:hypothetical protein
MQLVHSVVLVCSTGTLANVLAPVPKRAGGRCGSRPVVPRMVSRAIRAHQAWPVLRVQTVS